MNMNDFDAHMKPWMDLLTMDGPQVCANCSWARDREDGADGFECRLEMEPYDSESETDNGCLGWELEE